MYPLHFRSTAAHVPLFRGSATLGLIFSLIGAGSQSRAAGEPIRVNLGSFTGDENLSRVVAETLLTDIAKSGKISVLDARAGGEREEGTYLLTGSCLSFEGNVVINVRLVDGSTGRTLPGAAENAEGPKSTVFSLVHGLAGRLTNRLGADALPPQGAAPAKPSAGRATLPSVKPGLGLPLPHVSAGINLGGGKSSSTVTRSKPPIKPEEAELKNERAEVGDDRDPVMAEGQGDVRGDRGESHNDKRERPATRFEDPDRERGARYTSLIIDARGLGLDRSMCPVLRRRDGSVVWNGGEANPDFVISDGIVAYTNSMREARDQARAGSRPLIIEAVGRHETPFPSDPLLDDEDADYILKSAPRDGFLKKFRVIFVIGK